MKALVRQFDKNGAHINTRIEPDAEAFKARVNRHYPVVEEIETEHFFEMKCFATENQIQHHIAEARFAIYEPGTWAYDFYSKYELN